MYSILSYQLTKVYLNHRRLFHCNKIMISIYFSGFYLFLLQINAFANRAAGKGYENEAFYENIKFHFLGVENIHVMRNSLTKIIESK